MKKQSLIKGSLVLACAGILAKFLGLFFRWPLIMLIGDEGLGYYQMTYPLYMLFVAIAAGIPIAVSKLVSEKNALGKYEESFQVIKEALKVMVLLGIGTSIFLAVGGKFLLPFLKWDDKAYYSILGICLAPTLIGIITPIRGFFQGFQNMTPTAVSQILEQIGRVIVGVGLAYILIDKGIEYSAGGASFGAVAGAFVAALYLIPKYRKIKNSFKLGKIKGSHKIFMEIINIALPISIGAAVGSVMGVIDSVLVPQKLLQAGFTGQEATVLYAQLTGKATVFTNIPMTLATALAASIIPIISELYILKNKVQVKEKIDTTMKLCMIVSIPCFLGLFFMAEPIMNLLFLVGTQITTSILQGMGYYYRPVFHLFIGCILKVVLTMNLIPIRSLNIYGAVIATIISYSVVLILNLLYMSKRFKYAPNIKDVIIKPIFASILMIGTVLYLYTQALKYSGSFSVEEIKGRLRN
ncbi:MAG: polysaccharide biosynthesis protein [Clostridium perfringens]|nr:polysaccharide biosynthesis protein [Clostridium perfringens]